MKTNASRLRLASLVLLVMQPGLALLHAGTPLICQPYDIGAAPCLPGSTAGLRIDPAYDRTQLVPDTLALLQPQTPVIVRMETLRRAALYAVTDEHGGLFDRAPDVRQLAVVSALLEQLRERTRTAASDEARALTLFDLGFLAETLRHARVDPKVDGYAILTKARAMRGPDAEMEFALALASSWPQRKEHADHVAAARRDAVAGTLLAANLASHFD